MAEQPISLYRTIFLSSYHHLIQTGREGTPLGRIVEEMKEMIGSYLADARSFEEKDDLVNAYASLTYAHGWMDAGLFLGYFNGDSPSLFLTDDTIIPVSQEDRLIEKRNRYEKMLTLAIRSVEMAPESGSPFYQAAIDILKKAKEGTFDPDTKGSHLLASLGRISYGYGWLDAGIRAGLFIITQHPELFTTETCRDL